MKNKFLMYLLVSSCSLTLANCNSVVTSESNNPSDSNTEITDSENNSSMESEYYTVDPSSEVIEEEINLLGEDYDSCVSLDDVEENLAYNWDDEYAGTNFALEDDILCERIYKNNELVENTGTVSIGENDDVKELFYNRKNQARFVSKADGYCLTMPTETTLQTDFSIGKYRSKLYNEKSTLTVTYETSNPYSNWETYRNEWLLKFIENEDFYEQNNIEATRSFKANDNNVLKNYTVDQYDLVINDPGAIEKNYYNIAVLRPKGAVKIFYLLVMKSTENCEEEFDSIIQSFRIIDKEGKANINTMLELENKPNPKWNDETKAYYNKLLTQERTDWGVFVAPLLTGRRTSSQIKADISYTKKVALEEALDYNFDIIPTYGHLGWGNSMANDVWPTSAAKSMAGGNGFNGLPVIQMSYQFTTNNNTLSTDKATNCYTPMFDIYRGADDDDITSKRSKIYYAFISLAREVKAYEKPVLFRLNNEMNTDWTSYCGMLTLLDPDIFQVTWKILYNAFEKENVDNCIWIFNPIAKSCPYSSWGDAWSYYPGVDYVQALGLTYYEFNNGNDVSASTFKEDYTDLYNRYYPYWKNYPWIISEFGCGAGGETTGTRYRNQSSQVNYINGMFSDLNNRAANPYVQNIKGAVWFSCNDYANDGRVVNQLELVIDELPLTIKAVKAGLAQNKN